MAAAAAEGLAALAVTDHDSVEGVPQAREAARGVDLELVGGVELSSSFRGREIHLLGLFVQERTAELVTATERSRLHRRHRVEEIIQRLHGLGVDLDPETVDKIAGPGSVGRPHVAAALVGEGWASSLDEAFRSYLGLGRPAYVPKPTLPAEELVEVIHRSGGVAVLAHPGSSRIPDEDIVALARADLDGLEIRHPKHSPDQERHLATLAKRLGLLPSGGSDFHGRGSDDTPLGTHAVPMEWLERLRSRAATYSSKEETV